MKEGTSGLKIWNFKIEIKKKVIVGSMGLEIAERTLGGWGPAGARTRSEEESCTAMEQRESRDGSGKQCQLN